LAPKGPDGELAAPLLVVQASCEDLVDEIHTYRWKQPRGQRIDAPRAEPIKRNDDLLDALRYLVMSLPMKAKAPRIEDDEDEHPAGRAFRKHVAREAQEADRARRRRRVARGRRGCVVQPSTYA
jgi:hypothetical protein